MNKPVMSKDFTIDDIHKLREYNYEQTKDMTVKERSEYYNAKGRELHELIQLARNEKKCSAAPYGITSHSAI